METHNQTKMYISRKLRFVKVFTLTKSHAQSVSLCRSRKLVQESEVRLGPGWIPSSLRMFLMVCWLIFLMPSLP